MKTLMFIALMVVMMAAKVSVSVILFIGGLSAVCIGYFLYKVIIQIKDEYNRNDD